MIVGGPQVCGVVLLVRGAAGRGPRRRSASSASARTRRPSRRGWTASARDDACGVAAARPPTRPPRAADRRTRRSAREQSRNPPACLTRGGERETPRRRPPPARSQRARPSAASGDPDSGDLTLGRGDWVGMRPECGRTRPATPPERSSRRATVVGRARRPPQGWCARRSVRESATRSGSIADTRLGAGEGEVPAATPQASSARARRPAAALRPTGARRRRGRGAAGASPSPAPRPLLRDSSPQLSRPAPGAPPLPPPGRARHAARSRFLTVAPRSRSPSSSPR